MKCSHGISSRLPSFFDRKYFSCTQGCLTRNVVDIGEEESLIIEGVQESLQKTLLERSLNVQTLSDRIINALENSHIKDSKLKHPQTRKKMKRRKKRKPAAKCDVIRECDVILEGEIQAHARAGFALFENEYLLSHVTNCDSYISSKDSTHSYDNNSYISHCTSEKESAYSEAPSAARKRKKLQRRKKRKPKMKIPPFCGVPRGEAYVIGNVVGNAGNVIGTDNNSFDEDEGSFCVEIPPLELVPSSTPKSQPRAPNLMDLNSAGNQINNSSNNNNTFVNKYQNNSNSNNSNINNNNINNNNNNNINNNNNNNDSNNKENFNCSTLKSAATQTRCTAKFADIYKITKITDSDTTLDCDKEKDTKMVGKDDYINGSYTNIVGDMSLPSNVAGGGQFSKEQKRQFRRKMRNVKKRPESYVVLGMI